MRLIDPIGLKQALVVSAILDDKKTIEQIIDEQPTIIEERKWIPCSERLPENEEDSLVTDGESMAVGYYRQDAKAWDNADFGWIENREQRKGIWN